MTELVRTVRERRVETIVLRPRADTRVADLTATELRVAQAIARGWSTERIAAAHGRSKHTINNQVAAVFVKLGAGARADVTRLIACADARDVPAQLRAAVLEGRFQVVAEREGLDAHEFDVALRETGPSATMIEIARRCALAQSLKAIAIDLGVAGSTVSESLIRFMRAACVRDRAQLIQLMAPLIEASAASALVTAA